MLAGLIPNHMYAFKKILFIFIVKCYLPFLIAL